MSLLSRVSMLLVALVIFGMLFATTAATTSAQEIATPFGMMLPQCVSQVLSGSFVASVIEQDAIDAFGHGVLVVEPQQTDTSTPSTTTTLSICEFLDEAGELRLDVLQQRKQVDLLASGVARLLPRRDECITALNEKQREIMKANTKKIERNSSNVVGDVDMGDDGWQDYAIWQPTTVDVARFSSSYTAPAAAPKNDQGEEILFWFIGVQNVAFGQNMTILQPVLAWNGNQQPTTGWSFASWNCCPEGQAQMATPVFGMKQGSTMQGDIIVTGEKASNNNNGATAAATASVISTFGSSSSSLHVPLIDRTFNYAAIALETYYVSGCQDMALGRAQFDKMELVGVDKSQMQPQWQLTNSNLCGGKIVQQGNQTMIIEHRG